MAAAEIAHRLPKDPAIEEVIMVARRGSLAIESLDERRGLRLVALPADGRFELTRRVIWEACSLPRLARQHARVSVLSWSGILPRDVQAPTVCLLSNALMFQRPGAANRIRRWAVRRTVRRARHVLVPSHAMAGFVASTIGGRPEVVQHGIDHDRFTPTEQAGTELLCIADFYPHKRQELLLEAWTHLSRPRPVLRFIGDSRVNPSHHRRIAAAAARVQDLGQVMVEERIPQSELIAAYRRARVFVLPSLHESFCMPLVEAQACGVPAVVSDLPVFKETGGAGAVYVDSNAPNAWADALKPLFTDETAHTQMRDAGLRNARQFSWERTTDAIRARLLN